MIAEAHRTSVARAGTAAEGAADRDYTQFVQIVEGIQCGRTDTMVQLYRLLLTSPRFFLAGRIPGQDVEDRIHETFQVVVSAIKRGQLRDPERLMGFIYGVIRRQVAHIIGQAVTGRRMQSLETGKGIPSTLDPEQAAYSHERLEFAASILEEMPDLERAILIEFYLNEKPAAQIRAELNLTENQFRLLKSRAKERLGDLGRRRLLGRRLRLRAISAGRGASQGIGPAWRSS
jgi:RNA polymerase sigma factor (sigma-70 family)